MKRAQALIAKTYTLIAAETSRPHEQSLHTIVHLHTIPSHRPYSELEVYHRADETSPASLCEKLCWTASTSFKYA